MLERWERDGQQYLGCNGKLLLITWNDEHVTQGTKIANNLYKLDVSIQQPPNNNESSQTPHVLNTSEHAQSWETWHKCYGHIGYTGLQKLLDNKLVNGFVVDTTSAKPNCIPCKEAKQTTEPFKGVSHQDIIPGELTHIDLWGKYDVTSINGHQYYILFVDDSAQYIIVGFLKGKD